MVKIEFLSAEIPIINIYKHILDPEEIVQIWKNCFLSFHT